MQNISHKRPWPLSTIVLTSIVFTPIVGGILAGVNKARIGFLEKPWRELALSLIAAIWYVVYFFYDPFGPSVIFPISVVVTLLDSPMVSLPFLAFPYAIVIYVIAILQRKSWNEDLVKQTGLRPWWSAYLFGAFLVPFIGLFLFMLQYLLIEYQVLW